MLRKLFLATNLSTRRNVIRVCYYSKSNEKAQKEKKEEPLRKNIVIEKFGAITTLNIDRRHTRNSLDVATLKEITTAIDEFENDNKAMVLVFNGEGGTFCSGFDFDEIEKVGYSTMTDAAARILKRPLCDKITIAAVSGYAVAEGMELATSCDLRVIEDSAMIGCLGRRFGVPQSIYGGRKLTALIGLSRALDLLITGRLISGTEAERYGLACKLASTGTCLGEALKLAKTLISYPQSALIMDKLASVNSQLNPNSEESMRDEAVLTSLRGNLSTDIAKGIKQFQSGIGKQGTFYILTEVPFQDWEIEDIQQEDILHSRSSTSTNTDNSTGTDKSSSSGVKEEPKTGDVKKNG